MKLLATLASVTAFAPSARTPATGPLMALDVGQSPDGLGTDPGPLGFFDPLGLAADTESFPRRRAVELKHGRISMIAFIGIMVQKAGITFPGYIDLDKKVAFADIGTGFAALSKIPPFGVAQILLFGALAELVAMPSSQYTGGPQNLPAGFDGSAGTIPGGYPFTTQITDPAARTRALNVEIQNGRGAMLGVFGCMCHSMLDSTDHHFFYPITHN